MVFILLRLSSSFARDGDAALLPIAIPGLEKIKKQVDDGDLVLKEEIKKLTIDADRALKISPPSVMDRKELIGGLDPHDYVSYAPYWWPNPKTKNGLPYIRKDGHIYEKLRNKGDQQKFNTMVQSVQQLSLAFYFTGKEIYAEHAAQFLRVWFLNPKTKMNPNVEGGQIIRGRRDKGRRAAINEMRFLPNVVDSELMILKSKAWTVEDHQKLTNWFSDYFKWLTTSSHGKEEQDRPNNHATWYDVQYSAIAIYLGKVELAKVVFENAKSARIKTQIKPDGSMPLELERASSLHYSLYNITALFALATLAEKSKVDLWNYTTPDGAGMRKALDFTIPYIDSKKKWPYPELRDDEYWHWPFLVSQAVRAYPTANYKNILSATEKAAVGRSCTYCYRLTIESR